ncbi:MAG: hypothetical protein IKO32_11260 [Lachnospiraceae bacterium]|nr:hypothetical protein [Lachnospiraceae bacterium]
MRKLFKIILVSFIFMLFLTGCSDQGKEEKYAEDVSNFYVKINTYDAKINAIDSKAADADKQLLEIIDQMDAEFKNFAALEPPAGYDQAKEHATNASQCMTNAANYFHVAFSGEKVDETALQSAYLQYGNAITEVKNVGVALQNGN